MTIQQSTESVAIFVHVKTVSESNSHQHWRYRQQRAKQQRQCVGLELAAMKNEIPRLPVTVWLTRCSPRTLDDDNLRGALKHVRDEVAAFFGVDDRGPEISWQYAQRKQKGAGVEIRIDPVDSVMPDIGGVVKEGNSNGKVRTKTQAEPEVYRQRGLPHRPHL